MPRKYKAILPRVNNSAIAKLGIIDCVKNIAPITVIPSPKFKWTLKSRKKGNTQTKYIKNVDPCGVDLLSTFYWMRTIDISAYKPGDKIPVNIAIDDEVFDLYVRYDGKEIYKTKLGTFNCIKLKPLLLKGDVFKGGEDMTIWLTDDKNRIPVRVESDLSVGRVTCDLKSYGGLKHEFTSRVK